MRRNIVQTPQELFDVSTNGNRTAEPAQVVNDDHEDFPNVCVSSAELKTKEVSWLWAGRIPYGSVTCVVGASNVGKSTFLASVASWITGGPPIDKSKKIKPRSVLWFGVEECPQSMTQPKLQAAGADLRRVLHPGYSADGELTKRLHLPLHIDKLEDLVTKGKVGCVIFDPITSFLIPGFDLNGVLMARELMEMLGSLASRTGIVILVTLHFRKSRDGDPLDWVSGSAAWTQAARVVLSLGIHPDRPQQRVIAVSKNSLAKIGDSFTYELFSMGGAPQFLIGDVTSVAAKDIGSGSSADGERDALADAKSFLIETLKQEEMPVKDLERRAEESGIRPRTLRRAKEQLAIRSMAKGPNERRYFVWAPPEEGFKSGDR